MADLTYENALKAMRKAHSAGDMDAARRMAALAKQLQGQDERPSVGEGFMGQLNAGIASAVDTMSAPANAVSDLLRPLTGKPEDRPAADVFRGAGVRTAKREPETILGAMGRGAGLAAGYAPLTVMGGGIASTAPGVTGQVAGQLTRGLSSVPAFGTEMVAGALAEGGAEAVEQAGGGDLAQNVARVAAPMSLAAVRPTVAGAGRLAENMPLAGRVVQTGRDAARSLAPMTDYGARQVAREELVRRAGSPERARQLGARIDPNDQFGRSPAQMTRDPEFLGLEKAVKDTYPTVRVDMDRQTQRAGDAFKAALRQDGAPLDAKKFFDRYLQDRIDSTLRQADAALPQGQSTENLSNRVVRTLKSELEDQLTEERSLWAAVPMTVTASPAQARTVAQRWSNELGRAGAADMPPLARRLLLDESGYGDAESAQELHNLYSKLREIARNARAGTQTRPKLARVADDIADAILRDLDATEAPTTDLGQRLTAARNFSRSIHEKFDQGAVGRILKRTTAGDEAMTSEAALRRTVGVGNEEGGAAVDSIRGAAPTTDADTQAFLRSGFSEAVMDASGNFTRGKAATWLRNNQEALTRFPGLKRDLQNALRNRQNAESLVARFKATTAAGIANGPSDQAVTSILGSDNPATAARAVVATARKDPSGKALAGVKAAFSDRLIGQAVRPDGVLSGKGLQSLLRDQRMVAALRQVFSAQELRNIRRIAGAVEGMQVSPSGGEEIINAPVNEVLRRVVQVAAAQKGGRIGQSSSMGGSLQTANIMQRTATRMLEGLQNTKARQLLVDAVQDPELMRALLMRDAAKMPPSLRAKIAPYLAGTAATATEE